MPLCGSTRSARAGWRRVLHRDRVGELGRVARRIGRGRRHRAAERDRGRREREGRVAGAVGRDVLGAEVGLGLRRPRRVRPELQLVRPAGVEFSVPLTAVEAAAVVGGREHGEVLLEVRAAVAVAGVVDGPAEQRRRRQVDAQPAGVVDRVAQHLVADRLLEVRVGRVVAVDVDALPAGERDRVRVLPGWGRRSCSRRRRRCELPAVALRRASPFLLMPIELPRTSTPLAELRMTMPAAPLPAIRLPSPAPGPPISLLSAPCWTMTPDVLLPAAARPSGASPM